MGSTLASRLIALAAIGFAVAACAATPSQSAHKSASSNECVFFRSVYDWQALDDSNLVIWAPGRNDAYQVSLSMPLMGLRFATTLGFIDGTSDGMLCGYGRDAITIGNDPIQQRSTIGSMTRLNAESIAQLEVKYKVKLSHESKRKTLPKTPDRATAQ